MTITLAPETEAKLREKANDQGQDVNAVADAMLRMALEWEARDEEEAMEGIRRGLESSAARRVRPATEVFADMRAKIAAAKE